MLLSLSLALDCLCLTAAILYYDEERYQYEDSLIRGDPGDGLVRVLPLNYRLPAIPTSGPAIQSPGETNLTALVGSTVVLGCRVDNLGSSSVTWLRLPQLTVLTSGGSVFSSSPRVSLVHSPGSPDYNLQISQVERSDEGQYQCQLNTRTPTSRLVNLLTSQPLHHHHGHHLRSLPALALRAETALVTSQTRTEILAPDRLTHTEGGTVSLECVVTEHHNPPTQFTW